MPLADAARRKALPRVAAVLALTMFGVPGCNREAPAGPPPQTEARPATPSHGAPPGTQASPEVPAVRLGALTAEKPDLDAAERDPFRFRPKPPPPPPAPSKPVAAAPRDPNAPPPPPPPPPPIPLKFIGVVDTPGQGAKIAVLSDGRNVFYGREGDIIEGRYRVLRIGAESAELAYVDGRGRQMIRLSGQ